MVLHCSAVNLTFVAFFAKFLYLRVLKKTKAQFFFDFFVGTDFVQIFGYFETDKTDF